MVGTKNLGLVIDFWEIRTAGQSMEDVRKISADQIVSVNIADVKEDIGLGTLKESDRLFPGETGVIDSVGSLKLLDGTDLR